ncbi:phosphoglycerate mutase-like protein [Bimuria novae-zelandiae CBS 107.79]|uniref:Phosphoglycerate mutase-like protein n=1 Tax=Bimuria novae-zelandiae CBS 107.79 TaxID=1447943 RepID=A0A6A5VLA5_9PLEO|nr:phosphoglycerate mutase-like protein [Bimuria novae-zelandiae CBS 107.79]
MARQMRLFLIRHGETIDNVAQVYAGSRDSVLTNHGYQQATRLGLHFAAEGVTFTHLFSSHLQRAVKTAGLIRDAQPTRSDDGSVRPTPAVVQLPVLMEQDFGSYEGKKFYERPADGNQSGKERHRQAHKDCDGSVDVESKEALAQRADAFLDGHLLPLVNSMAEPTDLVIAIVSHGIMLSSLWKRLLARLPERSVKLAPELAATTPVTLEHLGGWSNTGYLELCISRTVPEVTMQAPLAVTEAAISTLTATPSLSVEACLQAEATAISGATEIVAPELAVSSPHHATTLGVRKLGRDWSTVICTINGKDHLKNLKRTRGGVGSSRHDASQKSIESFFKRRKLA